MKRTKLIAVVAVMLGLPWAVAQPILTTQAKDTLVSLGSSARFTPNATSSVPPVAYQWWFKDAPVDPVANPTAATGVLTFSKATLADAGPYFVVATDATPLSATSRVATLYVDTTKFTKITNDDRRCRHQPGPRPLASSLW